MDLQMNFSSNKELKFQNVKDILEYIPRFDHIVDCFNNDLKWNTDKLSLDDNYRKNVENSVIWMKANDYSYLQLIDYIYGWDKNELI